MSIVFRKRDHPEFIIFYINNKINRTRLVLPSENNTLSMLSIIQGSENPKL